jgi:hypothetical protein
MLPSVMVTLGGGPIQELFSGTNNGRLTTLPRCKTSIVSCWIGLQTTSGGLVPALPEVKYIPSAKEASQPLPREMEALLESDRTQFAWTEATSILFQVLLSLLLCNMLQVEKNARGCVPVIPDANISTGVMLFKEDAKWVLRFSMDTSGLPKSMSFLEE